MLERTGFSGRAHGPLIIESPDTTIVIPPQTTVSVDAFGNVAADLA